MPCLTDIDVDGAKLQKEIGRKKLNVTFEAKLATKENSLLDFKKAKKVHCSISARVSPRLLKTRIDIPYPIIVHVLLTFISIY